MRKCGGNRNRLSCMIGIIYVTIARRALSSVKSWQTELVCFIRDERISSVCPEETYLGGIIFNDICDAYVG
uniref:Uncharacterized protein n=1 Tax=Setaria italica TaxID=4555 RepID=K3ZBH8_SETIT